MVNIKDYTWVPTPSFLYRNYLYRKFSNFLSKDDYFLDIGSGNGEFVKYLLKKGLQGDAIDISKEAVTFMGQQLKGFKGVNIKLANLFTYKPAVKYDVIFMFEVLEHIEDDQLALKKIYQLLKPNGTFILSVPAHQKDWDKIDEIKGHFRHYERKELLGKLKKANFVIESFISYGFPLLWILRKVTKTGKLIKSYTESLTQEEKTKISSLRQEYPPSLKFLVANPLILYPMFKIMDLFLQTDLGLGYIAMVKKV